MRATILPGLLVLITLSSGCADKLHEDRSFTLPEGGGVDFKKFELPAQNREQTIRLEFSSNEPIDLFVFLDKSADTVDDLTNDKRSTLAAGSQRNATTGTLSVKVPAKSTPTVLAAISKLSPKKVEVKLKMTN